jgi:hypothetical protein
VKRALTIAAGVALSMAGLWGGAYGLHVWGVEDWRAFPVCMTATFAFIAGVAITAWGVA